MRTKSKMLVAVLEESKGMGYLGVKYSGLLKTKEK
jgi:hypothetical protein